jgi:hypothetical protein
MAAGDYSGGEGSGKKQLLGLIAASPILTCRRRSRIMTPVLMDP